MKLFLLLIFKYCQGWQSYFKPGKRRPVKLLKFIVAAKPGKDIRRAVKVYEADLKKDDEIVSHGRLPAQCH